MRLTVLGCSGTFPGPDSPCSGYLVEAEGYRLLVDLGAGALGGLQQQCGLLDVDAVYVSHLHADHCIDLVAYSYARRFHPAGTPAPLPIYGPSGLAARIHRAYEVAPDDDLMDVYDFRERAADGELELGPFTVRTGLMTHPAECHGMRIRAGGRQLTYSGDTAASAELVRLAEGADLLLCEASWLSDPVPPPDIHLTGREAGAHATRAGVDRLVLTHLMPFADKDRMLAEAKETFAGDLLLAAQGASYDI